MTVTCLNPTPATPTTRMGRRKQNCPQKTGENNGPNANENESGDKVDVQNDVSNANDDDSKTIEGSASDSASENNEKETVTMPTLESLEPESNSNGIRNSEPTKSMFNQEEAFANMLKNHPLLNPAVMSLNPSLYAVQFAQLQAALQQSAGLQQLAAAASANNSSKRTNSMDSDDLSNYRKRKMQQEQQEEEYSNALNLSKKSPEMVSSKLVERLRGNAESPLDLSGSKAAAAFSAAMSSPAAAKVPKMEDMAKMSAGGLNPWASSFPFLNPFLYQETMNKFPGAAAAAAAAAAVSRMPPSSSPSSMIAQSSSNSSTSTTSSFDNKNPLERMSEIVKTGGNSGNSGGGRSGGMGGPRHSAWQSQWINRGPESTKEIFKCVWCKDSFSTLQALTTHMKETKHFGSSISPSPQVPGRPPPQHTPTSSTRSAPMSSPSPSSATSPSQKGRDILKEQLPMPRKLVRGQDVWLGRGEQQTKDILKCMWCGESFRTLDLMTKHMQETKHYTKVISQEQLVSWKSSDTQSPAQNHVNAVLTCKVCEQPFSSLKELSDHMVKNNHYKEQIRPGSSEAPANRRSTPPLSSSAATSSSATLAAVAAANGASGAALARSLAAAGLVGPGLSQPKEKRKKSLPVRKLLELERAQLEISGHIKTSTDESAGKISCEKCGEKILMHLFVDHIRRCVGPVSMSHSPDMSSSATRTPSVSPPKTSEANKSNKSPSTNPNTAEGVKEEPKSILGSLEKMVQNNFGNKKKPGPETNLSILQRLGIDEGVDYSKPLLDPMAMFRPPNMSPGFANFFAHHNNQKSNNDETRSNSDCSSPDRFKIERPSSIKSETSVKSPVSYAGDNMKSSPISTPEKKEPSLDREVLDKSNGQADDIKVEVDVKEEEKDCKIKEEEGEEEEEVANKSTTPKTEEPSSPAGSVSHQSENQEEEEKVKDLEEDEVDMRQDRQTNGDQKKSGSGKKKSHPLAALQMLCDKTEKTPKSVVTSNANLYGTPADPGAILAFSWACNQAVVNDSLLKCPFCDTPFISKGAYRHHLSKMHFVKDGSSPDPKMLMGSRGDGGNGSRTPDKSPTPNSHPVETKEENAQSKFAKYSQLAKQLSCSSQP